MARIVWYIADLSGNTASGERIVGASQFISLPLTVVYLTEVLDTTAIAQENPYSCISMASITTSELMADSISILDT